MAEAPPPWIVFPDLHPNDPATQGVEEAYIDLEWLPFWRSLGDQQREDYLRRWTATVEWREVIAERFEPESFDVEDDARDSAAWSQSRRSRSAV